MKELFVFLKRVVDGAIYLFIGPFTVIGTIPIMLVQLDSHLGLPNFTSETAARAGYIVMNIGAVLAIWSSLKMFLIRGTPIPSAPPKKVVDTGPYAYVRHPMMYSLLIVGIGEIFVTGSLLMLLWVPIGCRAGMLFIDAYEEPVLIARFGEAYQAYCEEVPRWIPKPISRLFP